MESGYMKAKSQQHKKHGQYTHDIMSTQARLFTIPLSVLANFKHAVLTLLQMPT